jgi:hypothetical protein
MSPCINICSLDEQGFCRGCHRSRNEIAGWIDMTPAQRHTVLRWTEQRRLGGRRAAND